MGDGDVLIFCDFDEEGCGWEIVVDVVFIFVSC